MGLKTINCGDSGESSSSEKNQQKPGTHDERLTQQEWEDLLSESDDKDFEGFV